MSGMESHCGINGTFGLIRKRGRGHGLACHTSNSCEIWRGKGSRISRGVTLPARPHEVAYHSPDRDSDNLSPARLRFWSSHKATKPQRHCREMTFQNSCSHLCGFVALCEPSQKRHKKRRPLAEPPFRNSNVKRTPVKEAYFFFAAFSSSAACAAASLAMGMRKGLQLT